MHRILTAAVLLAGASPLAAAEQKLEVWLNPSATIFVDDATFVELETAQRFREVPAGDTYYARLWLGREVFNEVTVSAAVERRHEGAGRETRLLQQIGYPLGPLGARTRLEQRFIEGDPRTGWRVRQRLGGAIPLSSSEGGWQAVGKVEGFFTLAASKPGAQTGFTGLRTFIGLEREFGALELSVGYLRQQTIREGAPDTVGHAPFVALGATF